MTLARGPLEPGVDAHAPPAMIGDYRVGVRLGGGNYGDVYRASHSAIDRDVAIKILHADRCHDPEAVARFVDEARAVNLVRHPGIVEIFGFGVLGDGRHYCVMELLAGTTLHEVLERRGHLPLTEALPVLRGIAEAIDAAHAAGIAHRDIKPENVMVLDGGGTKLIDFGLAKLVVSGVQTQTGAVLGTPRYMAPEQCRGQRSDERADLYAFGALAYHVLVGAPPFAGDALALALHHVNDVPLPASARRPELNPVVDTVLAALLAKAPSRRPRPLADAVAALTRPPRRRRWPLVVPALAVAAAGIGGSLWWRQPATSAPVPNPLVTPIAIDQEHVFAPGVTADGEVSFMNEQGLWSYRDGKAKLVDATASYRSQFGDGSWLVTHESASEGPSAWLERAGTPPRKLATGAWAEATSVGSRFVIVRDGVVWLATRDTPDVFQLALRLDDSSGGWSPDGSKGIGTTPWLRGVFGRGNTMVLGTGGFRDVDLVTLEGPPALRSVSFVTSDEALYCGRDGVLRIRDLVSGRDRDVLALPEGTGSCDLAVTRDLERAFVSAGIEHDRGGWLDPRSGVIEDVASAACPGEVGMVAYEGVRLHAVRPTATTLVFATDACRPVYVWTLPAGATSPPSCAGARCLVAMQLADRLELYAFDDGVAPHRVATARAAWASGRWPVVALSRDGRAAVGARGARAVLVYASIDAPPQTIELPPSHAATWMPPTSIESLAFAGDALYASGVGVDGVRYGIYRLGVDGARDPVWRSETVRAKLDGTSDGDRLGFVRMEITSKPMWVELTR